MGEASMKTFGVVCAVLSLIILPSMVSAAIIGFEEFTSADSGKDITEVDGSYGGLDWTLPESPGHWEIDSDANGKPFNGSSSNNWLKGYAIDLQYNIRTGLWYGDDYNVGDPSGYGRLCGCDDGSIYKDENDCELYFNIYQNDFDNDGLPYWIETFVYKTDPEISNLGEDKDKDSVPIEWEHRWGFNPLLWEDHANYDSDDDSLNNTEEYLTSSYGSDPYRRDLFLEMDIMEDNLTGRKLAVPDSTFELMKDPFNRRNIVFHIEFNENQGGEMIKYDNYTENEVKQMFTAIEKELAQTKKKFDNYSSEDFGEFKFKI